MVSNGAQGKGIMASSPCLSSCTSLSSWGQGITEVSLPQGAEPKDEDMEQDAGDPSYLSSTALHKAATRIQSHYRGYTVRKAYKVGQRMTRLMPTTLRLKA